MNIAKVNRWTGTVGIIAYILTMIVIPLWFIHPEAPTVENVLTRTLINMFVMIGIVLFWAGFREIVRQSHPSYEWLATISFISAVVHVALTFAAESMHVGSVLRTGGGVDPTVIGGGAEGSLLILGPIARLLSVLALGVIGYVIIRSLILPKWTGWLALAIALFHVALIPTLYSTTDPSYFYSINGWNIPVAGGLYLLWVLVASIILFARKPKIDNT